jgi:uncharacterized Zn finger protein (UPF0148 family)
MIKLNPCKMCGAMPNRSTDYVLRRETYTVYCPVCGNEIEDSKYTMDEAEAAWNADNPKIISGN